MRQLSSTILLIFFMLILGIQPSSAALKGGIDYSLPIDYSKLSESELAYKAQPIYLKVIESEGSNLDEDTTTALGLYTTLQNINPNSIEYCVKLGRLYDKINKDRYAKGNYSRAIGIDPKSPIPYYYMGDFYYRRQMYRKALKYFKQAYKCGYYNYSDMLDKMSKIYKMFGDEENASYYSGGAQPQLRK